MSYSPPGWEDDCRCPLCGTAAFPPWITDDETWAAVMGDSVQQVCIGCFFERIPSALLPVTVQLVG